jgi:hypothetical protein
MASENKLMLLNLASRHVLADEVYVEVGCWRGLSLAGAAAGNGTHIYACDDFSMRRRDRDILTQTIARQTAKGQVRFYEMDFRKFLTLAPWRPRRVGGYFYDGNHSFARQFEALELIVPWLSDDAVVVVDDTNDAPVRAANRLFTRCLPGLEVVADIRTRTPRAATWWNGVQVFRYRRGLTSDLALPPRLAFLGHQVVFNSWVTIVQRLLKVAWWGPRYYQERFINGRRAALEARGPARAAPGG